MGFEIKDLSGLGEPIKKLIDVIAQGCGTVTRSHFIRKDVKAKAKEIREIGGAFKDVGLLPGKIEYKDGKISISGDQKEDQLSLQDRVSKQITYQQAKQQQNIESITQIAAELIAQKDTVNDEPVDSDWINNFFNSAQFVSNEEMQKLWGKILAGEVKQPGSYSLRTLHLLKTLTRNEAKLFQRVSKLAIIEGESAFIFANRINRVQIRPRGFSYSDEIKLIECGLIVQRQNLQLDFVLDPAKEDFVNFLMGNYLVQIRNKETLNVTKIPTIEFTQSGSEFLKLIEIEPDVKYINGFAEFLKSQNLEVKWAKVASFSDDESMYRSKFVDHFDQLP